MGKAGTKKKSAWFFIYLFFVLALIAAIVWGLVFVWRECERYQANSAETIVKKTWEELEKKTGLEFESDLIPKRSKDGAYVYVLKHGGEPSAEIRLAQTGSGIMDLALFELKDVTCLSEYTVVIGEGAEIFVDNAAVDTADAEDFSFVGMDTLRERGFALPSFKAVTVDSAFDFSQISVEKDGQYLELVKLSDGLYYAAMPMDKDTSEAIKSRVESLSDTYSHYMSSDVGFYELSRNIIYGSPLNERFSELDVSWYSSHYWAENVNLRLSEPVYLGDRWVLAASAFDFDVFYADTEAQIPTELTFLLYLDDYGRWNMAELATSISYEGMME